MRSYINISVHDYGVLSKGMNIIHLEDVGLSESATLEDFQVAVTKKLNALRSEGVPEIQPDDFNIILYGKLLKEYDCTAAEFYAELTRHPRMHIAPKPKKLCQHAPVPKQQPVSTKVYPSFFLKDLCGKVQEINGLELAESATVNDLKIAIMQKLNLMRSENAPEIKIERFRLILNGVSIEDLEISASDCLRQIYNSAATIIVPTFRDLRLGDAAQPVQVSQVGFLTNDVDLRDRVERPTNVPKQQPVSTKVYPSFFLKDLCGKVQEINGLELAESATVNDLKIAIMQKLNLMRSENAPEIKIERFRLILNGVSIEDLEISASDCLRQIYNSAATIIVPTFRDLRLGDAAQPVQVSQVGFLTNDVDLRDRVERPTDDVDHRDRVEKPKCAIM